MWFLGQCFSGSLYHSGENRTVIPYSECHSWPNDNPGIWIHIHRALATLCVGWIYQVDEPDKFKFELKIFLVPAPDEPKMPTMSQRQEATACLNQLSHCRTRNIPRRCTYILRLGRGAGLTASKTTPSIPSKKYDVKITPSIPSK